MKISSEKKITTIEREREKEEEEEDEETGWANLCREEEG